MCSCGANKLKVIDYLAFDFTQNNGRETLFPAAYLEVGVFDTRFSQMDDVSNLEMQIFVTLGQPEELVP